MRTPQQYIEEYLKCPLLAPVDVKEEYPLTIEFIATIQKEAFECGRSWGLREAIDDCNVARNLDALSAHLLVKASTVHTPPHLDCCATDQCKVTSETK